MNNRMRLYVCGVATLLLGWLLGATMLSAQRKYAEPYPRDGAIKLQETELLAFWEVLHEKGKPSAMHELPLDQLTVTLTEGAIKFTKPDGTSRIELQRLGSVRFESKGTVLQEDGVSDVPSREIVVQLKDVAPPKWPVTAGVPGQFPRLDAVKLFENARIRVWDQTWLPNRPVTNHLHYTPTAAVFLSAGRFRTGTLASPRIIRPRGISGSFSRARARLPCLTKRNGFQASRAQSGLSSNRTGDITAHWRLPVIPRSGTLPG